jgi:acetyl esterase/lipase
MSYGREAACLLQGGSRQWYHETCSAKFGNSRLLEGNHLMKRFNIVLFLVVSLTVLSTPLLVGQDRVGFSRQDEVIYGRKHGLAMTLDVFTPKDNANGVGVIAVVSGGWFSNRGSLVSPAGMLPRVFNKQIEELLRRGYTVFAVVHGSQPKYTVPEILEDMHRAVRYVRHNASTYKVDPERLGIFGGSAGGHLSLMQGTAGIVRNEPANPVDRESSRVQAVVAYYPPTDFLNYGVEGGYFDKHVRDLLGGRNPFLAAVDFREFDNEKQIFFRVAGEKEIRKRLADISPANHVTPDDPPTLIIHGDADRLVPIQQSELIMERFKQAKVTAMLKVMPGKDHGWAAEAEEVKLFADWFDQHLAK